MNLQCIKLNLTTYSISLQLSGPNTLIFNYTSYEHTVNYAESIRAITIYLFQANYTEGSYTLKLTVCCLLTAIY